MGIDEPWDDEPPRQVQCLHPARDGRGRGQRGDAPIGADHHVEGRRARGPRLHDPPPMQYAWLCVHAYSFPCRRQ
jgi:hypothetical protein